MDPINLAALIGGRAGRRGATEKIWAELGRSSEGVRALNERTLGSYLILAHGVLQVGSLDSSSIPSDPIGDSRWLMSPGNRLQAQNELRATTATYQGEIKDTWMEKYYFKSEMYKNKSHSIIICFFVNKRNTVIHGWTVIDEIHKAVIFIFTITLDV